MRARNRKQGTGWRAREARRLAGMIAAGVLLGSVATWMLRAAGEWMDPGTAEAQAAQGKVVAAAKAQPAGAAPMRPATKVAAGSTAGATAGAGGAAPARSASGATPAKSTPAATPRSAAAPAKPGARAKGSAIVQSSAHLDEQVTYHYNALGRRDPFQSLISGEYVGADVGGDAPPDVGGLKVVGIVWGDADQFALVEDVRGDSHILRRGDKVMNGYVESLKRDAMIVNLTVDGQSQSVSVPLTRKGEKTNANR